MRCRTFSVFDGAVTVLAVAVILHAAYTLLFSNWLFCSWQFIIWQFDR